MKKDKWLKWKIGAMASIGIGLLFHQIKASSGFEQALASASATNPAKADILEQPGSNTDGSSEPRYPTKDSGSNSTQREHTRSHRGQGTYSTGSPSGTESDSEQSTAPQSRTQTKTGRS